MGAGDTFLRIQNLFTLTNRAGHFDDLSFKNATFIGIIVIPSIIGKQYFGLFSLNLKDVETSFESVLKNSGLNQRKKSENWLKDLDHLNTIGDEIERGT